MRPPESTCGVGLAATSKRRRGDLVSYCHAPEVHPGAAMRARYALHDIRQGLTCLGLAHARRQGVDTSEHGKGNSRLADAFSFMVVTSTKLVVGRNSK
jgi:hypothetical protein